MSGAGGDAGIGIIKSLLRSSLDLEVIAASADSESAGLYLTDLSFVSMPVNDRNYIDFLCEKLIELKVDFYIPGVDSEILIIARNAGEITQRTGTVCLVGNENSVAVCSDKWLTHQWLSSAGLRSPETELASSTPLATSDILIKPRFGRGSKGITYLRSGARAPSLDKPNDFILQEWLPNDIPEITCGVLILGDSVFFQAFVRKLAGGSTVLASSYEMRDVDRNQIIGAAKQLGEGYWNFQAKLSNVGPIVFEVNPRFSGTTSIVSEFFNGPELWLRWLLKLPLPDSTNSAQRSERVWVKYLEQLEIDPEKHRMLNGSID